MRTISFFDARNRPKQVIDRAVEDRGVTIITRRDAPDAVLMSLETFNSWRETVYLLKTPANVAHLTNSIRQLRAGEVGPRDLGDA